MYIDNDDENFWLETVKHIKKNNDNNIVVSQKKINIKSENKVYFAAKQDFSTYSKYVEDIEGGVDKATMRKFKHEGFKTEAVLDLHGFTENEAFEKVDCFIAKCYNEGKRCVVIITGKGQTIIENDDIFTTKGVLRRLVPQWLEMPRIRAMILVYKHTSDKLGGSGALYILLKRNKNINF